MKRIKKNDNKPIVGFFPCFTSIGEALPLLKIAKIYQKKGGKLIIFSHGGKFEHLSKDIDCKLIKLKRITWEKKIDELRKKGKIDKIPYEKILFAVYDKNLIESFVKDEIQAFKKAGVDIIITTFNPTASVSVRALNIPLIVITSGTSIPPYYRQASISFPENYENAIFKLIPDYIKNQIAKYILLNSKILVRDFNRVAKKYGVKPFNNINDILLGDYNFICDDINFLGIEPTKKFPIENFIGPISGGLLEKQKDTLDADIKRHINRPGKSILLMMGNTRDKKLYLNIMKALNTTNHNVIAVYTTIEEKNLPKVNENILLKKFIKSPKLVNKLVDLSIIHGGRGTVYTSAYSGKPIIGIPMYCEHQYNIDNIVTKGAGIRLSKKFFKKSDLLDAINTIFSDYDTYLKNAQKLSETLTKEPGEKKATKRLIEIVKKNIVS
ncbi:hypothetical protein AYK21_00550 [Thermoplasmatales archaeon SG8-52-2]|nr:MAG: hypothetical protein AYK21_00550 [Thermoplasmatales archaeon SG8-52-2]